MPLQNWRNNDQQHSEEESTTICAEESTCSHPVGSRLSKGLVSESSKRGHRLHLCLGDVTANHWPPSVHGESVRVFSSHPSPYLYHWNMVQKLYYSLERGLMFNKWCGEDGVAVVPFTKVCHARAKGIEYAWKTLRKGTGRRR